jgi:hypothetical protein
MRGEIKMILPVDAEKLGGPEAVLRELVQASRRHRGGVRA